MRRVLLPIVLLLLALGCGGDDGSCGDAGCPAALLFHLGYPQAAAFGIRGTVTVGAGAEGRSEDFVCPGPGACTTGELLGRATLWQADDGSWELQLYQAADVVELELVRDAIPFGTARVEPAYGESFRPNGSGCGPVCREAEETVTWTPID